MVTIRPALPDEEAGVVTLWRDCGLVVDTNDPAADFRFACLGASSAVLVAVETDAVVGGVMVGHDGHRGWIYYLACAPHRQGSGIGRGLVRAAEHWLRERGVAKLNLMVRETNTTVLGFYEKLGFDLTPRIVMAKWLT